MHLPTKLLNQGTKLLNQQCWAWGYDVRRPAGNLLLDYGFARQARPSAETRGSSAYHFSPAHDARVTLWTFGVVYAVAGQGALYLNRFVFDPRLLASHELPPNIWLPEQLPPHARPQTPADWERTTAMLPAACRWIASYEQWVLDTQGLAYRQETIAAWSRAKMALPPAELPARWLAFVEALAATTSDE
ncbi:MAG: hypothetical protein MUD01_08490 [Chloroflexaceae bacterium]|jgi:hypothetical protein|nr:hypothetical protein [Chloroflexaceae bacterium]